MNRAGSLLGGAMVIAISVVFIVQFQPGQTGGQTGTSTKCAVEVEGECLSTQHFWAAYRLLAPRGASEDDLAGMNLKRIVAEGLVERHLLAQDAERLGIAVADEDLTPELAAGRARVSLPAENLRALAYSLGLDEGLVRYLNVAGRDGNKKFDTKQYTTEVRLVTRLSPSDFREFQREELLAARMRDLVRSRVHVGEPEAFERFQREKSTATVDYVTIDKAFLADAVLDTSTKAVEAFAEAHKEDVEKAWEARKSQFLPECRAARHILARVDRFGADPEGQKAKAKEKIESVQKRLAAGESFEALAKELSDDGSASRGGDLGCVTRGRMVKPFEDALFALAEGQTSGVVESEFGLHLIKLDKIAKEAEAEKIGRLQVAREAYLAQETERLAREAAGRIQAAVAGGKPLQAAVDEYLASLPAKSSSASGPAGKGPTQKASAGKPEEAKDAAEAHPGRPTVETSSPFNVSGVPFPGIRPGADAAAKIFQTLEKPGDVLGDVVPLFSGYAVVVLKAKEPATKEQWEKERDYYLSALRAARQDDALAAYVKQLRARSGKEIKYDTSLFASNRVKAGDQPEPPPEGE